MDESVYGLMQLLPYFQQWAGLVALFMIRPAIAFLLLPATADPMLTATTRNLLALTFAAFTATGTILNHPPALAAQAYVGIIAREVAIGVMLGFAAGQVLWVAQCAGALVDNVSGYNNIQITNPSSPEQSTPVSDILLQMAVGLFWMLGGMLMFFGALLDTHRWWPIFSPTPVWPAWNVNVPIDFYAQLMRTIASVSAPLLFLIALIDVGMGMVSRAAKNVDTNPLAQPLRAAAAVLSLSLFAAVFLQDVKSYLSLGELSAWLQQWRAAK